MLVLTRKPGEEIIIGGNVRIKVLQTKSGGVRLGIEAPRGTPIVRAELKGKPEGPATIPLPDRSDPLSTLRRAG